MCVSFDLKEKSWHGLPWKTGKEWRKTWARLGLRVSNLAGFQVSFADYFYCFFTGSIIFGLPFLPFQLINNQVIAMVSFPPRGEKHPL